MTSDPDQLSKSQHDRIFRDRIVAESGFDVVTSQEHPRAVILGGQPGAGKGGLARAAAREMRGDAVEIDPDELRKYHPEFGRYSRENPYSWSSRTHKDAGAWADELLAEAVSGRKNLVFDTTLSNGDWAADSFIAGLKEKGYQVEMHVVAAHKLESEIGVDQRFAGGLDREGYGRHVPKAARMTAWAF